MTLLILIFGEIIPKSFATHNNILIARFVIVPIYWLSILFFPIVKFLNFIPRLTGKISKTPTVTEEELMTILEVVEEEGEIKQEERALIHNIFEFDDTSASEIMTPRADMFVIDADQELPMTEIIQSGYTRIPVIQGDTDHVIGILNTKDLLKYQVSSVPSAKLDIAAIMRKPYFVPESKKLDKLLHQFKLRKHHIAIVVDEHGGVSGLITLEDVVEEIVGDISDETDKVDPHIVKLKNKEWLVLGKSDIDEVNKKLRMDLPDSKDYDTFSGYILDKTGRIPNENETIKIDGFTVIVKEMDGNRINAFIIKKN
jgi:CBS domain containing-hemolysin-like protein